MKDAIIVIPVRYNSKRLPGKLFKEVNGKPVLWYTADAATKTGFEVMLAIDYDCMPFADRFPPSIVDRVWTEECRNGTDRVHTAYRMRFCNSLQHKVIVNWQADWPLVDPGKVKHGVDWLCSIAPEPWATFVCDLEAGEFDNPNVVKCVEVSPDCCFFRNPSGILHKHVGVYFWRAEFLQAALSIPMLAGLCDMEQKQWSDTLYPSLLNHTRTFGIDDEASLSRFTDEISNQPIESSA